MKNTGDPRDNPTYNEWLDEEIKVYLNLFESRGYDLKQHYDINVDDVKAIIQHYEESLDVTRVVGLKVMLKKDLFRHLAIAGDKIDLNFIDYLIHPKNERIGLFMWDWAPYLKARFPNQQKTKKSHYTERILKLIASLQRDQDCPQRVTQGMILLLKLEFERLKKEQSQKSDNVNWYGPTYRKLEEFRSKWIPQSSGGLKGGAPRNDVVNLVAHIAHEHIFERTGKDNHRLIGYILCQAFPNYMKKRLADMEARAFIGNHVRDIARYLLREKTEMKGAYTEFYRIYKSWRSKKMRGKPV